MKKNKKIIAEVYLKHIKKPVVTLIFEDENKLNSYFAKRLEKKEHVIIGNVIFNVENLSHIVIK